MLNDKQNNRIALVALFIGAAVMATVIANPNTPAAPAPTASPR